MNFIFENAKYKNLEASQTILILVIKSLMNNDDAQWIRNLKE